MYTTNNLGLYGGLGKSWGAQPVITNPEDFIPKKGKKITYHQASLWATGKPGLKTPKEKVPKGDVYWTKGGPQYSKKKVKGGGLLKTVPKVVKKKQKDIAVVRDLPKVSLPPLTLPSLPSTPLGDFGFGSKKCWMVAALGLGVLCLIICKSMR